MIWEAVAKVSQLVPAGSCESVSQELQLRKTVWCFCFVSLYVILYF